jgi:hypothetical protein
MRARASASEVIGLASVASIVSCKIRRARREKVQTFRNNFTVKILRLALIPRT